MSSQSQPQDAAAQPKILWSPEAVEETLIGQFAAKFGGFGDYESLLKWSVENPEDFWTAVWDFCGMVGDKGKIVIQETNQVPWAKFFPDSKISYAENALARAESHPDEPAIIARTQGDPDRVLRWQDVYDQVSLWEQALKRAGIGEGDCVAVYMPNLPETVILLLAVSQCGAVFCSAGMEMGPDDMIARFTQAAPKILIAADGYVHGEKKIGRLDVVAKAQEKISTIQQTIILPYINEGHLEGAQSAEDFTGGLAPQKINFIRRDFNQPLYILFSSGTTGQPKCFEHSSGGVLLKHLCEYQLQSDVRPGDRVFYHATPSWMMWNWLASGLASGATILMYDGSPAYPDGGAQWAFTADNQCTHHGTAAPVILSWADAKLRPAENFDLSPLRCVMSTGAVLPAQGFTYIHDHIKQDVKVSPISGGTDIVGCFVSGNPMMPTYAGQINAPMLGMDVRVWNEDGQDCAPEEVGELVCCNAFPSMPLRFLNDEDGARYTSEYFEYYRAPKGTRPIWRHGDAIRKTAQGQLVIIGRSDATLNQNGVRIGSATIYAQLEPFADQIADSAAVNFTRPDNSQQITVLFLALKDGGADVPEDLQKAIRKAVKDNITPYAMPTEILAVPGILKTPNGKKAEVVIQKILGGKKIPNASLYGVDLVTRFEEIGVALTAKYTAVA